MTYQTQVMLPCAESRRSVTIKPDLAIIVSRAESGAHDIDGRIAPIITTHRITSERGQSPQIGHGTIVSPANVKEMFADLGIRQPMYFHDDRVLATGADGFIWHQPPRTAPMHWRIGDQRHRLNVRWPHLLFSVSVTAGLRVYAIAPCGRPKVSDALYQAPLGNIYDNASLCWGSIQEPERTLSHRAEYEDAIYATNFTHANATVLAPDAKASGRKDGRQDLFAYWKARSANQPKPVPLQHLLRTRLCIGDLL